MTKPVLESAWRRRMGVRLRSTLAAVAVVAVTLVLGGAAVVLLLQISLTKSVDQAVVQRAADIAAQVKADDFTAAIPTINASAGDGTLVQVLSPTGEVLASSPDIRGESALTSARPGAGRVVRTNVQLAVGGGGEYRLAARGVHTKSGTLTVVTANTLGSVGTATNTVASILAIVAPLLLLAVGGATWFAVGRSLRAVERIRLRVDEIGASDLHQRVPVPMAEDEVGRLAVTMNRMLERLDGSAAAQRRFIADASHELRSPLASLRASVEVAQQAGPVEDWDITSAVIADEVERMSHVVDDLLLLARIDDGGTPNHPQEIDLDDVVTAEARRLRSQTGLAVNAVCDPVKIWADPSQLGRALRNLLDNAARYATTTIAIRVRRVDSEAWVEVDDDGPGIPVAERSRVVERFVRLDDDRGRASGGTGLGLAIVAEIAHANGGSLHMTGGSLGGTGAQLRLPVSS